MVTSNSIYPVCETPTQLKPWEHNLALTIKQVNPKKAHKYLELVNLFEYEEICKESWHATS